MPLDAGLVQAAAARNDVAVVVIGRAAGEDRENEVAPGSYLLTDDERALLEAVAGSFRRTVVVVDSGNVMDLSWADALGTSALASSWNPPMVEHLACLHADEMLRKGSDVLLAPGMNIHRDPLCGRNFEYFSEDPLLTGLVAAAHVRGIQSAGVSACPKHFAANNQETNRIRNDSRVSERALREVYLKGFRICVEDAASQNIMTAYNKVNGVWAHYHHDLVTTILRGEWGYAGNVVTDWWMREAPDPDFPALRDSAYRIRAGVDVLMPGNTESDANALDGAIMAAYGRDDGLTLGELQQVARHVLGFLVASGRLDRRPVNGPLRERPPIGEWPGAEG